MAFELDENFDKRLLAGSGVALAGYAVLASVAPAKISDLYVEPVSSAASVGRAQRPRLGPPPLTAAARERARCLLPCVQTEVCHEPTTRCELFAKTQAWDRGELL